jgi:hypothetical protein
MAWDAGVFRLPRLLVSGGGPLCVAPERPPRRMASYPPRAIPQLVATAPNSIWSWDSTRLPTRYRSHFSTGHLGSGVGMDVLGSEGAPPRLEGADPGLHARDVDGRGRVGEVRVVGF